MTKKINRGIAVLLFCVYIALSACGSSFAAFESGFGNLSGSEAIPGASQSSGFGEFGFGGFASSSAVDKSNRAFFQHFSADSILTFYDNITEDDKPQKRIQCIIKNYKKYLQLEAMVEQEIQNAAAMASKKLGSSTASLESHGGSCKYISPGWKYFASILPLIDSEEDFERIIVVDSITAQSGNSTNTIYVVSFENMQQAAMALAGEDGATFLKARSMYAYLLTVYNDRARSIRFKQQKLPAFMEEELIYPLESTIRIRKSWYAGRDRGTRKHTGTDIHAGEGTEIYSCSDGIVLYIGYAATPGYYVTVEDPLGYEYHYYHMVVKTDFLEQGQAVKAGDILGHVGNTGNSTVNHLHITIVAPDGKYVDPYPIMIAAKKRADSN